MAVERMMRVSELIRDLPISPSDGDVDISGVTHDSRRVGTGDLFVALAGERFDGLAFVDEARERGAVAVLSAGGRPAEWRGPWLETEEPRRVLGHLASRLCGHPDRDLVVVGVTGTNGKSSVAALVGAILEAAGRPTGILGTLGFAFRELARPVSHTTLEATELFRRLREVRDAGGEAVVMEVSSHALAQHRVGGAGFDLALFLNLSRDHLDYHRDSEDYFQAKRRLFSQLKPGGRAVVNVDDVHGRRLAAEQRNAVTFGDQGLVRVRDAALSASGITATWETPLGEVAARSVLLGRYNLENLSAAVGAAVALELPVDAIVRGLALASPPPGRMERVDRGQDFLALIDYAHTPDALRAALEAARELSGRRVILVFGCGGERDEGKRAMMGRIAGELAALPVITSDNPRHEDPLRIIAAIETGMKESGNTDYRVVPDRREAIRRAVHHAGSDCCVLVAGKGHEHVQVVGDRKLPFSDRQEIEKALEERLGAGTDG